MKKIIIVLCINSILSCSHRAEKTPFTDEEFNDMRNQEIEEMVNKEEKRHTDYVPNY